MLRVATGSENDTTLGIVKNIKIDGSELIQFLAVEIPASSASTKFKFLGCEIDLHLPGEDRITTIARLAAALDPLKKTHTIVFENCNLTLEQIALLIIVTFHLNYDLPIVVNETAKNAEKPLDEMFINTSSTMQQYGTWIRRWRNYWWKDVVTDTDLEMQAFVKEYQALITKSAVFQWHFHYGYIMTSIAIKKQSPSKVSDWAQHERTGWAIHAEMVQYLAKLNKSNRSDLREMKLQVSNLMNDIKIYFPFSGDESEVVKAIYYMSFGAYEMTRYLAADLLGTHQKVADMTATFDQLMKMYHSVRTRVEQYQCWDKEVLRLYLAHTALMMKLADYLAHYNVPIDELSIAYFHGKDGQSRFINLVVLANVKACGSTTVYDVGIGLCLFITRQIYNVCEIDINERENRVNAVLLRLDNLMCANANSIAAKLVYIHVANEMLLQFEAGIAGTKDLSKKDIQYLTGIYRKLRSLHEKWGGVIRPSNVKDHSRSHFQYQAWCATNMMKVFDLTYLYRTEEKNIKDLVSDDVPIPRFQLFDLFTKLKQELPDPLLLCGDYLDRLSVGDSSRTGTVLEICTTISHQSSSHVLAHRKYFCLLVSKLAEWLAMCVNEVRKTVEAKAERDVSNENDYQVLQDICNYAENVADALMYPNNREALYSIYSAQDVTMMHIHMLQVVALLPGLRVGLGELRDLALKNIADRVAAAREQSVRRSIVVAAKELVNVDARKPQQKKNAKARVAKQPAKSPTAPVKPAPAKTPKKVIAVAEESEASTSTNSTGVILMATKPSAPKRQKVSSFVIKMDQLIQRKKFKEAIQSAEDYLEALQHEEQKTPLIEYPHLAVLYYRLYECVLAEGGKSNATALTRAKKYLETSLPYLMDALASRLVEEGGQLSSLLSMMQDEIKKHNIVIATIATATNSDEPVALPTIVELPTIQYDNDVRTLIAQLVANVPGARVYTFGSHNTAQVYKALHADGFEPHVSDVDLLLCVDNSDVALAHIKKVFPRFYHSSKLLHLELFRGQFGRWKIDLVISTESVQQFIDKSDLTIKSIVADEQGKIIGSGITMLEDMRNKKVQFMPGFAKRFAEYPDPTLLMNYIRALIVYPGFEPIAYPGVEPMESHLQFVRDHKGILVRLPNATATFQKHFQSGNAKRTVKLWYENGLFEVLLPDVAKTLPDHMQVYLDFCEQFDHSFKQYGRYDAGSGEYVIACLLRLAANIAVGDESDGRHEMWYAGSAVSKVGWLTKAELASIRAIICHKKTCQRIDVPENSVFVETNLITQSSHLLFSSATNSASVSTTQLLPLPKNKTNRQGNGH